MKHFDDLKHALSQQERHDWSKQPVENTDTDCLNKDAVLFARKQLEGAA